MGLLESKISAMPGFHHLHDVLINFFYDYLPLPCTLILAQDPGYSHFVSVPQRGLQASHFELRFGRRQLRWDYNAHCLAKAAKTGKAVLGEHAGMQDLFIPILEGKRHRAWLLLGSFQGRLPGRDQCWAQWKKLRQQPDVDDGSDFLLYVQARMDTPVIDAALRMAITPVLGAAGAALLGLGPAVVAADGLNRLKTQVVTRRTPWRMWHYTESKRDRLNFDQGPYEAREVMPWDAAEFGLKRAPDTALAFCPRDPGDDPAEALVQTARLQAAVFDACQGLPGLVAGRWGAEGALILAAVLKRSEGQELAHRLQTKLSRATGSAALCSWSAHPGRPEGLWSAIAGAEAGLRLGLARGLSLLEAPVAVSEGLALERLEALAREMADAWSEGRVEAARLVRSKLAEEALKASGGRSEPLKLNLRWTLSPLVLRLEQRGGGGVQAGPWRAEINAALEGSSSSRELVQRFGVLAESLGQRLLRPLDGERRQVLRRALRSIEAQPESPLGLQGLARDLGLSSSRVSRLIKAGAGAGFAQARTQARLAKAKRLLVESPLSLANIAAECGWAAQAHFSRVFRVHEGLSPRDYRKKNQINS